MATVADQTVPAEVPLRDLEGLHTQTETQQPISEFSPHPSPTVPAASLTEGPFPEGGARANLVILGSFATMTAAFGLINSLGIFQSYLATHQLSRYPPSFTAWISGVNIFLTFFFGVQVGPLFDAYGPRWIMLISSVMYIISLLLFAECRELWQYILVFGVLAGVCGAALTTTAVAVIAHWFEKRRGWANGLACVGGSVGGIMFPLVLNPTLEKFGWTWAIRIVALIVAIFLLLGNVLLKGRLERGKKDAVVDFRCFRDERFVWTTMGLAGKSPFL
jgi:MFS family permease